jgi:hypothetical protein
LADTKPPLVGFTPGPWTVEDAGDVQNPGLYICGPNRAENVICDLINREALHKGDVGDIQPEDLANARLIASAPDLYEALKACVEALSEDRCLRESEWSAILQLSTAALSKATGEGE